MFVQLACVVLLLFTSALCDDSKNQVGDDCQLPENLIEEIRSYGPIVDKIIDATVNGRFKGSTYNDLATFVDKFGARVSGTKNLEDSIDYILNLMKERNLENVHGEDVQVPHWVRGQETASLVEPRLADIPILGLGYSVPTPKGGIQAEVLVVRSFDELNQANFSSKAAGKIVVYNNEYVSYGVSVAYRGQGASKAAEKGAVAALVRSVTPYSHRTLHTGHQTYEEGVNKIPVASITVEDARFLQRLQDREERIVVNLTMENVDYGDSLSRNAVAEIQGSENPEKVVLLSGHIDSWDGGVGAMDDGGGAAISWNGLAILKALNLTAKRTLRTVLWTGEEAGLVGAFEYNRTHFDELDNFVFVMESDEGTFTPRGLEYTAGTTGGCIIKEIVKLFGAINTTQASYDSDVGSDITIWVETGIPGASLLNDNANYFWYHHSPADTMDLEDPESLDKATALWAASAYIIADLSLDFPRED